MRHEVQWLAPAPFWGEAANADESSRTVLPRPAILRFASDGFMDEFNRVLETDPAKLRDLEARFETWKEPLAASAGVVPQAEPESRRTRRLRWLRMASRNRGSAVVRASSAIQEPSQPWPAAAGAPLKLYQPAHQRFYLVAASLVCRRIGFPDRELNTGAQERASFVLRRLDEGVDPVTRQPYRTEYAYVPANGSGAWSKLSTPDVSTAPLEERLPLFAVCFRDPSGRRRRVLAGLVPVGRREAYVGAPEAAAPATPATKVAGGDADPGAPAPPVDPRIALLSAEVIEPWKALVQRAYKDGELLDRRVHSDDRTDDERANDRAAEITASRENVQVGSWYVLLDFATFLQRQAPDIWAALTGASSPRPEPDRQAAVDEVVAAIEGTRLQPSLVSALKGDRQQIEVKTNLKDALLAIAGNTAIENVTEPFSAAASEGWPAFLFPLADLASMAEPPVPALSVHLPESPSPLTRPLRRISALRDLIAEALPAQPTYAVPDLPLAAHPVMAPDRRSTFVLRCVYDRPDCGGVTPAVLSAPSRPFELASFFDPQAPARPIRIALPIDTSPAGLRRAPKNTAFMISDMLCGQIARAKGLGLVDLVCSVLPFPLHKDLGGGGAAPCKTDAGASLGMICSLSIPIITICALIVLMVMVAVLDVIFRWLPYFIFCFPLPNFGAKAKGQP